MLELYLDEKFHLSSEIEVVEVENVNSNVGFFSDSLYKLHREFGLKSSKIMEIQRFFNFHHLYLRLKWNFSVR